jgi:CRP-like cAMP-binding protein
MIKKNTRMVYQLFNKESAIKERIMDKNSLTGLECLPLLTCVEPELVTLLCKRAAVSKLLKSGEALFKQGERSEVLYVVRQGNFKSVWTNKEGKEIILQISGKGEFLGVNSLCEQRCHLTTAIAMEDARVCVLSRDKLEQAVQDYPHIALQIICNLGNRLNDVSQQVVEFRVGAARERVYNLLVRMAAEYGEPHPQGKCIKIKLTQQDIASFVGLSRVMVAQALKELVSSHHVIRENNRYVIVN